MLIGITGRAGVGKDTAASHLKRQHKFAHFAFADPLRAMLCAGFALTPEHFAHGLKEELIPWIGRSPRQLMQSLGTEWGRNLVNPHLWVETMSQRLVGAGVPFGAHVVVSDVRMENEAALIRRMGGRVLHLYRAAARPVSFHVSEDGIGTQPSDLAYANNGTPGELFAFLDGLLEDDHSRRQHETH